MAYILNKTNGTVLATVNDGSINQTTDLTFVGKNYAGYGEFINEDLLRLLENFSNKTAPPKAITGQLWYDSTNKKLKIYDGSTFRLLSLLETTSATPKNLNLGDFWFNTSENKLYIKDSNGAFTLIGPNISNVGDSGNTVASVLDDDGNSHTIIKTILKGTTVAVSSKDDFNLKSDESLYTDFKRVRRGITVATSDKDSGESKTDDYYFWGTAAHSLNSDSFQGYVPADFVFASAGGGELVIDSDDGVLVGTSPGMFRFHANSGNTEGRISVIHGTKIGFSVLYPTISDSLQNVLNIVGNKLLPGTATNVSFYVGDATHKFAYVYANTFSGTTVTSVSVQATNGVFTNISGSLTGNVTGNVTGDVTGNTAGTHTGPVIGAVTGNTAGTHTGPVIGAVTGNTAGTHTGPVVTTNLSAGAVGTAGVITGQWTLAPGSTLEATSGISLSLSNLSAGTYLTGGIYNGSAPVTFAVDATNANTASKVVVRDGNGGFNAGQIKAESFVETKIAMPGNAIDLSSANYFTKTIVANTTFTISNTPSSGLVGSFILDLTNGGAFTVTWWANLKWANGSAPTLTASGRDVLGFFTHNAGSTWNGFVLGKKMA